MQPPESSYLDILSAERRVTAGFILFVAGIFGVLAVFAGSFVAALFVILVSEYVLTLWRPTPRLGGPSSYQTPGAPTLRPVIVAFRWYSLFNGWRGLVSGSIFCIGFLAFVLIFTRPTSFDAWNYAVLVLFGVWLFGRPLWAPAVGRWLARSTVGIRAQLEAWSPAISVTSDGLDIDLRAKTIGRPQKRWVISVTFAELDEVRTLGALEAQAYWQSLEQVDPTVSVRLGADMYRYANGQIARPSIYQYTTVGVHILIRGATVLYLIGGVDQTAPPAVAAWQSWVTAHPKPEPSGALRRAR